MIIAKRLKGKAIATWLGPTGDAARRALTRARQRITNAPRRLDFYFDIADPMSYLTAQAVSRLVAAGARVTSNRHESDRASRICRGH